MSTPTVNGEAMPLSAKQARDIIFDLEEQICDLAREALASKIIVTQLNDIMSDLANGGIVFLNAYYEERLLASDFVERVYWQAKKLRETYYSTFDEVVALARSEAEQQSPGKPSRKPANDVGTANVLQ